MTCVVSVAFREPYVTHSRNQRERIREVNPDVDQIIFEDVLPAKGIIHKTDIVSHFQKSLYGFKPHAIQHAIDAGHKKVIWLDPSVLPASLTPIIDALDDHPIIVISGDHNIRSMVNNKALRWFDVEDLNLNHLGGTMYAFNFNFPKAVEVFELWKKAEEDGIFGDQDAFMAGHWADESCMALSLAKCGVKQVSLDNFQYINQKK